jgi:hypothetical protein
MRSVAPKYLPVSRCEANDGEFPDDCNAGHRGDRSRLDVGPPPATFPCVMRETSSRSSTIRTLDEYAVARANVGAL